MTIGFVLGNGISRKDVSLPYLRRLGTIYGCNALYREFAPDVLVATDRPISTEIQNCGYANRHKFYTRKPVAGLGAHKVPDAYYGFSSGPIAVGLSALNGHDRIYLIGFDMGPVNNKFNNIYADTEFYKTSDHPPIFTGNWVKQLVKVMSDFPNIKFYRVTGPTTAKIPEFNSVNNLLDQDLQGFLDRINNQKDL